MLRALIKEARDCRVCAAHLPLGPRPVFLVGAGARLLVVGQHPRPRNRRWLRNNPWFVKEVVPALRHRVRTL